MLEQVAVALAGRADARLAGQIDCETSKPVELLAGREAKPLADWLQAGHQLRHVAGRAAVEETEILFEGESGADLSDGALSLPGHAGALLR